MLIFLLWFVALAAAVDPHGPGGQYAAWGVWPQPFEFQWTNDDQQPITATLSPSFTIKCSTTGSVGAPCAPSSAIAASVQRYATTGLIFRAGAPNATASLPLASGAAVISSLAVVVDDMTPALALRVSESYLLTINASGAATLTAPTQWGAMRGLETFSQAVQYRGGGAYTISNLPLRISDKPRFAWRGLTIDCSRHFIEIPALLRAIDAMSYTKMNILHLHVSDDQSWSLHSSRYPAFTEQGAFSTPSAMYSVAQQQQLSAYASSRGVMIYAEFDSPGHSASIWGRAMPQCTSNYTDGSGRPTTRPGAVLEPTGASGVFDVLGNLTAEATMNLGNTSLIHFGGEPVVPVSYWEADPRVRKWARAKGAPFVVDPTNATSAINTTWLRLWFSLNIARKAVSIGVKPVLYVDAFAGGLGSPGSAGGLGSFPPTTTFAAWSGPDFAPPIRAGFDALSNHGWYLDQTNPGGQQEYGRMDYWKNFWALEPCAGGQPTPLTLNECEQHLLGGEVSAWTLAADSATLDSFVWPRTLGAAERLWSQSGEPMASDHFVNVSFVAGRLEQMRCRMVTRGIAAGATQPQSQGNYANGGCALPRSYSPWLPELPTSTTVA
mgnify:FL=1